MRKPVPARAAHHRPLPPDCEPLENQSPTARSAVATLSTNAMPNVAARAAAAWRPCRFHSPHTGPAAQRPKTHVVPCGGGMRSGQPRCARGNLKAGAEGDNEDDERVVRSEGSGPQSLARVPCAPPAPGDLRSHGHPTAARTTDDHLPPAQQNAPPPISHIRPTTPARHARSPAHTAPALVHKTPRSPFTCPHR